LLTGYFLRSHKLSSYSNPKSWELLGSNDNITWNQIDEQINRVWVTKDWAEVYFPVESNIPFSHFKFVQTGKNNYYNDKFLINYVEFFGTIFPQ
jgi:hypothetical protein